MRGLRGVPSGRLRINAPPPAIDLVLAPMVAPFLHAYPQIDLEIVGESSFVDIVAQGFDAGVRYGEHLAQDMIAVSLGPPQRYAVVASPDYVARHGKPKHPKDLLDHRCIRIRFGSGAMLDWEFEKAGRRGEGLAAGEIDRELSRSRATRRPRRVWLLADLRRLCARRRSNPARWSACSTTGARRFRDRFCIIRAGASRRRRSPPSLPLSPNGESGSGGGAMRVK